MPLLYSLFSSASVVFSEREGDNLRMGNREQEREKENPRRRTKEQEQEKENQRDGRRS